MVFISVMKTPTRGGTNRTPDDGVRFAKNKGGDGRMSCSITIGATMVRHMRWVDGDRIQIKFDTEARLICIARVPQEETGVALRMKTRVGSARTQTMLPDFAMDAIFPGESRIYVPRPLSETGQGIVFPYPS